MHERDKETEKGKARGAKEFCLLGCSATYAEIIVQILRWK
jgi:hypothetical protein